MVAMDTTLGEFIAQSVNTIRGDIHMILRYYILHSKDRTEGG